MGFWESFREKKKSGYFEKKNKTKGKAKRENFWWEDQEDYYTKYGGGNYSYGTQGEITGWDGGGYSRKTEFASGYTYSYKQPFDMSVSLESRIKGLIQTITGQSKQLLVADGWGIDQNNIYYNPRDIDSNATDDRVLGQILHQLSVALYYDQKKANSVMRKEPEYKHLLLALEHNRVDRQLQHYYFGCKYYAESYWQESGKHALKPSEHQRFRENDGNPYNGTIKSLAEVPASQFNYAIHSHSNGEQSFEIADKKTAKGFQKARPLIEQYIDEPEFAEAVKIYEQIKKYYPVPSKEAQEQMDRSNQGQVINAQGKRRAVAQASQGKPMGDGDGNKESEAGRKGGFYDTKIENPTREQSAYWQAHAKHLGTINTLHQLLKSIIADNEANKFIRPFKRGKLDAKRIHKFVATGNMRIFKQRKAIDKKKYGMVLMVDQSGSMSGELSKQAMESAVVLTEVFNRLELPFAIIGFSDDTYMYKGFNQSVPRETVCSLQRTYGGTNDLGALKKVEKQLEAVFQHQRTGVFVITDGCGYDQNSMRAQVDRIEQKNAKVFGIGIGGVYKEDLDRAYTKNTAVPEIAGLPRELANLLKGQFRRS